MSNLKKFEIVESVGHCEGTQTFACFAESEEEALLKHKHGKSELISDDVEVQDFSGSPEVFESDDISSCLLSDRVTELEKMLDKANAALGAIYDSGDYSRATLNILRDGLGIESLGEDGGFSDE